MKTENLKKVEELVAALNTELKIDETFEENRKLEKQIRKIAKGLVKDINTVMKKKISREEKLLAQEVKRQKRASRILAARQILEGKLRPVTTAV